MLGIFKEKKYKIALTYIKIAHKTSPDDTRILTCLGAIEHRLNMYEASLQHLEKSYSLDSTDANTRNALAMTYSKLNRFDEAIVLMDSLLVEYPKNFSYQINAGMVETQIASALMEEGKDSMAMLHIAKMDTHYVAALALGCDPVAYYLNRGYGHCMVESYDTARYYYGQIGENIPMNSMTKNNNIAVSLALQLDYSSSRKYFRKAKSSLDTKWNNILQKINNNIRYLNYNANNEYAENPSKKYNSIVYYYVDVNKPNPRLGNQYKKPYLTLIVEAPEHVSEIIAYDDNTLCDPLGKQVISTIKNKSKKRKYNGDCPTF